MQTPNVVFLAEAVSWLCGWTYFLCWSVSFYPQPLLNLRRRSTVGATLDFPVVNTLGFLFYLLATVLLYWSPAVRAQHAARHPAHPTPTVRANDVAFALHAIVLCGLTLSMFVQPLWGLKQKKPQTVAGYIAGVAIGSVVAVLAVTVLVLGWGDGTARTWAWIDVVNTMSWAKLFITTVKYVPQVVSNYRRRSTVGWSIGQILCDLSGGALSVLQLLIDSALQGDWKAGFSGNPLKFWLGNISVFFDVIFIYQHYWLYRQARTETPERAGLLAPDED